MLFFKYSSVTLWEAYIYCKHLIEMNIHVLLSIFIYFCIYLLNNTVEEEFHSHDSAVDL